jgi:Ras-related protein Rab-8A
VEKILIGNKCDLETKKVIDTNQGAELAKEFGMSFYETSARTGFQVNETFFAIAKSIKDKLAKS